MAETNKTESSARITNLLSGLVARLHSTPLRNFAEQLIGIFPADGSHESVNISRCFCTEVDVIGVLVHVERKNRRATCERMAVVRCPLIDELPITWGPEKKDPTRTACERFAHGNEFRMPALIRAKVASKRVTQNRPGFALLTKSIEKQFMQDH